MNRLTRLYNQNREIIFGIIFVIAFIIIIITTLNSIVKRQNEEKRQNNLDNNVNIVDTNVTPLNPTDKSVITGEDVSKNEDKTNTNLIKQFVDYCNNKQIEEAYNLLSSECKELLYPSIDSFMNNYYNTIFYINRMYELENWYKDGEFCTYYIKYTEDVLATGNVNSTDNRGDYITVVNRGENSYINISSFIGREKKDKQKTEDNVLVKVNYIDFYMDYAILNISITNKTTKTICIDTKEKVNTCYLYDTNDVKYTAMLNENAMEQLIVKRDMTNNVNIKFNKMFNPERELSGVVFEDIVLNYEDYINQISKKEKTIINEQI